MKPVRSLMTPLLKKEIRLLLPAWCMTLVLAVVPPLLLYARHDPDAAIDDFMPVCLGLLILCASSFGREFSLGTFSGLLALPCPRRTFWLTKISVLTAALVSIMLAYGLCTYASVLTSVGWPQIGCVVLLALTAIAGGLWLALVVRQVIAVVWLIALIPGLALVPFLLALTYFHAADKTNGIILSGVLALYSVAGIAGSWLLFRRAQDAGWSGGTITPPRWLAVRILPQSAGTGRHYAPWAALIRKELHFNQVLLLGMAGLFLFDLGEVAVRFFLRHSTGDLPSILQVIGLMFWALMPLIIGCTSIAEERKQGTMEGQLCQPVAARRQFWVKFGFVALFGGLVSCLLPILAEVIAQGLGAAQEEPPAPMVACLITVMCGIAVIGFFASSLTRNMLQAIPIAIGMIVGIFALMMSFATFSGMNSVSLIPGFILWSPQLPCILLTLSLFVALPWLAYRNVRRLPENARLWWRNLLGLAATILLTMAASVLVYHRAWEKLTPLEPPHGVARWTVNQGPRAVPADVFNNLLIALPDGRYWFGYLGDRRTTQPRTWAATIWNLLLPENARPTLKVAQFVPGSSWDSVAAGYVDVWIEPQGRSRTWRHIINSRETVAIRDDGTLWVSEKPTGSVWNTNALVQVGAENDWQEVLGERSMSSVLLLKKNGTLWRWGDKTDHWSSVPAHWQGLRTMTPRRIDASSDWQHLLQLSSAGAQKKDGSVWYVRFDSKAQRDILVLDTNLARAGFAVPGLESGKLSNVGMAEAGIRPDGTLWIWGEHLHGQKIPHFEALECGTETNWTALAVERLALVALKSDGTLWRWGGDPNSPQEFADRFSAMPVRRGAHDDWVALLQTWDGPLSLAADGSLWLWPEDGYRYEYRNLNLTEPPEKPIPLGNILATK